MEASIWKRFLNVSKSIHISLNRSFTTLDTEQTSNFQAGGKIHHQNEILLLHQSASWNASNLLPSLFRWSELEFKYGNDYDLISKHGPVPASFCLFSFFYHYNFNTIHWKKCRWCAWDSNPGSLDGRYRRNNRAMAWPYF